MTFSPRPHPAPCACEECLTWARELVAVKVKKPETLPVAARDAPLADFYRSVIAIACKATGMTEEELRRRGRDIESEIPEIPVQRVDRETVIARGVPEKHARAIYDREPIACQALDAVRTFLASDKTMLVLSGGAGLRKTGSACWGLTVKPGVFVTADELLRLAGSRIPDEVEQWRRVRNAQLLVIDDLGGEYSDDKGWGLKVIGSLHDHRYSNELKTIETTNLTLHQYKVDYGERVADRIRESGRFETLKGESVRRVKA